MTRLQNENQKLKRNLNPIKISDKEGLYVWHYNDELKYRITKRTTEFYLPQLED